MAEQVVFGGMPAWLLATYLVELGGERGDDGTAVSGDGWRATLENRGGWTGGIARISVTIEGERSAAVMEALRKKAQRGGG
ncbi:MAG: DUF1952 domain-containing protein [Chloroflexi bacterium]|nr:DUF1952 domain-containing protein [Chloroflexota bacterium]